MNKTYCPSLTEYRRRVARVVNIGGVPMGGEFPIRVQSMTTVDTMDTLGSVEQTLRMVAAGCEYVRITAPSMKEAQNLLEIKKELRKRGCNVPLIADIHFTPNAAELAARIVEKVRVNPGNYADKKKFEEIEYTDATYAAEVERIRERFRPLVQICKQYGTAMRIGTNHGSLSDRILSRYGDTPLGMVESALEFPAPLRGGKLLRRGAEHEGQQHPGDGAGLPPAGAKARRRRPATLPAAPGRDRGRRGRGRPHQERRGHRHAARRRPGRHRARERLPKRPRPKPRWPAC